MVSESSIAYVSFTDDSKTTVDSIYANHQPDSDAHPNQGNIDIEDPRYLSFINRELLAPETDPVEKLRAFLAANPDVAAILS